VDGNADSLEKITLSFHESGQWNSKQLLLFAAGTNPMIVSLRSVFSHMAETDVICKNFHV
jgi:hypothetical protein